jgi:Na+/H+ antiporter NhaC
MFVVPMTVLVLATLYFNKDFLVGIYITLGGTAIFILTTRMMGMHDLFDTIIDGFKMMIEPLGVLVAAFILKDVNDTLGLAPYVVYTMQPHTRIPARRYFCLDGARIVHDGFKLGSVRYRAADCDRACQ